MFRYLLAALVFASAAGAGSDPAYISSIEEWRRDRETKLKAPDGWLSVAGLFWLQPGENTVGSTDGSRVKLPPGFPAFAGILRVQGKTVTFRPPSGQTRRLRTDKSGTPDILPIGRLSLTVIERGTKLGLRMKDPQSAARASFQGLSWFPVDESWRIQARFVRRPKHVTVDAQAGDRQDYESPGFVEWRRDGRIVRMTPVQEDDQLFFIFRDATAGKTTYPAARFLYTDMPKNGRVVVDFNKAYNPPCVFTPYATCPLPPPENRLAIPVEAGEKMYRH